MHWIAYVMTPATCPPSPQLPITPQAASFKGEGGADLKSMGRLVRALPQYRYYACGVTMGCVLLWRGLPGEGPNSPHSPCLPCCGPPWAPVLPPCPHINPFLSHEPATQGAAVQTGGACGAGHAPHCQRGRQPPDGVWKAGTGSGVRRRHLQGGHRPALPERQHSPRREGRWGF